MAKQSWPVIKKRVYPNGSIGWTADCRINGTGERLTFKSKAEAQTAAEQARTRRTNEGERAFSMEPGDREDAAAALVLLKPLGATLKQAAEFFKKHVRVVKGEMSIEGLVTELLASKKRDGASVRYLQDLSSRLHIFAAAFPGQKLVDFSQAQIDDWLRASPYGPVGRNNFRRLVSIAFNFAVGRGYCLSNPAKGTAKAKEGNEAPGILTPEQTGALLSKAPENIQAALAIQAFAGLRRAEVQRLTWANVRLASALIEVPASKAKSARRRLVPIQANLLAWLTPYAGHAGHVAPSTYREQLDAARSAAGIKEWPSNALRHGYASYHLAKHGNAAELALALGHTNASLIFSAYRELVTPSDAAGFWEIRPAGQESGKVVQMVA